MNRCLHKCLYLLGEQPSSDGDHTNLESKSDPSSVSPNVLSAAEPATLSSSSPDPPLPKAPHSGTHTADLLTTQSALLHLAFISLSLNNPLAALRHSLRCLKVSPSSPDTEYALSFFFFFSAFLLFDVHFLFLHSIRSLFCLFYFFFVPAS